MKNENITRDEGTPEWVLNHPAEKRPDKPTGCHHCWNGEVENVCCFWMSVNRSVGFPYYSLLATEYIHDIQELRIDFQLGRVIIRGPNALDLYNEFRIQRATNVRADGEHIRSVELQLRERRD